MEIRENLRKKTMVAKLNTSDLRAFSAVQSMCDSLTKRACIKGVREKANAVFDAIEALCPTAEIALTEPAKEEAKHETAAAK
jgi:2-phosphoglycerate kinase